MGGGSLAGKDSRSTSSRSSSRFRSSGAVRETATSSRRASGVFCCSAVDGGATGCGVGRPSAVGDRVTTGMGWFDMVCLSVGFACTWIAHLAKRDRLEQGMRRHRATRTSHDGGTSSRVRYGAVTTVAVSSVPGSAWVLGVCWLSAGRGNKINASW
jgi:hypothetical protein